MENKNDIINNLAERHKKTRLEVEFLASYMLLSFDVDVCMMDFKEALGLILTRCIKNEITVRELVKADMLGGTAIKAICSDIWIKVQDGSC